MTQAAKSRAEAPLTGTSMPDVHSLGPARTRIAAVSPAERDYASALHRHLGGMPPGEIDFFVNARRFDLIEQLAGRELRRKGTEILNVACGPFALEFYMQLSDAKITSFDREAKLTALHGALLAEGLVTNVEFVVADVHDFTPDAVFDAVVINDLFYTKYVDFYALIGKYAGFLRPGGLLYFDIQDERAGPIWRAFGKDAEYRRYDLKEVLKTLHALGLSINSTTPSLGIKGGIKGGLDGVLRKGLWYTAGIANSFAFVARKT